MEHSKETKQEQPVEVVGKLEVPMPTPREIVSKYLEAPDNKYLREQKDTCEQDLVNLKKKQAKQKDKFTESYQISYLESQIEYYKLTMTQGVLRHSARANVLKTLNLYADKPVVVAGLIENLMGLFIIRGKQKTFAFVVQKGDFWIGGYSYKIGFVSDENFFKIFEDVLINQKNPQNVAHIYNQEMYEQIKKELLVRAIQHK